jgi:tetratricopeptide (TPR) repeat protein
MGLKTQVALAERIADIEGLDSAPKDLVNRVFRELPVEPVTLERVARALGVEAWTLYLASDEPVAPPRLSEPESDGGPAHRSSRVPVALRVSVLAALLLLAAGMLWRTVPLQSSTPGGSGVSQRASAILGAGRPTLAVPRFRGEPTADLAEPLRAALGARFAVAGPELEVLTDTRDLAAIAQRLRTDVVVDGEAVSAGRWIGVRLYIYRNGARQQVWAESLLRARWEAERRALIGRLTDAVAVALGGGGSAVGPGDGFPMALAQDDYLEARMHLDGPANELNLKRAQTRFMAALRKSPSYARAHAGLCQALLEEHWMSDAERALREAEQACARAMKLAPDDRVVGLAHAHYLLLTGHTDASIGRYDALLEQTPGDPDALAGLSSARLHAWRQGAEDVQLEQAIAAAERATAADPWFWKPPFWLASLRYYSGDVAAAIAAAELALARQVNEYVLANLGTFRFCLGDLEGAREAYLQAMDVAPHSYVGREFLGQVHYYLGEFERARDLRLAALAAVDTGQPEIHEMWGNLGDAYRQLDQREPALEAYLRAAEILERDRLRGTATLADRAARAFYYTAIAELAPTRMTAALAREVDAELEALRGEELEPTAGVRLALAWIGRGDFAAARMAIEHASKRCPVYARQPGLEALPLAAR